MEGDRRSGEVKGVLGGKADSTGHCFNDTTPLNAARR